MQRFNYNGRWLTFEQYQKALNEPVDEVTTEVEQSTNEEPNEPVEPNLALTEQEETLTTNTVINKPKKTKKSK